MNAGIDFSSWVAGWTALVFVVLYGSIVLLSSLNVHRARSQVPYRVLVTGTRGKSGTVRLIHAAISGTIPSYAKITGTVARELWPDGTETPTIRWGAATACEMATSLSTAQKHHAQAGIFECMAVTPIMISLVQNSHIQADTVVIPSIRLDHLEEEGLSEEDIAMSIIRSVGHPSVIVTGVTQPSLRALYDDYCMTEGIQLDMIYPDEKTPRVPGHHPTNVAIALHVAAMFGVSADDAHSHIMASSLEPRALDSWVYTCADSTELALVDLGGANDPESAWEALTHLGVNNATVVPILVNRWERPLRSVSFFASMRGHFPLIGITGTLTRWINSRHRVEMFRNSREHTESQYFRLHGSMARNPEKLLATIRQTLPDHTPRIVIILIENTHETSADILRATFEQRGQLTPLLSWADSV